MRELLIVLAIAAGCALPIQAAINGQLRAHAGSPVLTSLISFGTGTIVLAVIHFVVLRGAWPGWSTLGRASWWMWLGGPLGTLFVLAGVLAAPRLGTTSMMVLVIAGQLLMAVLLDHFGLLGLPLREAGVARIAGVLMVLAGAVLVTRF